MKPFRHVSKFHILFRYSSLLTDGQRRECAIIKKWLEGKFYVPYFIAKALQSGRNVTA
jgi:hypothetical protein